MKTTLKLAAVAALATISLTAAAKLSEGKAYGDWKGTCQGSECGAIQIVNNEKGEPVGRILLRRIPEAQKQRCRIHHRAAGREPARGHGTGRRWQRAGRHPV